MSPHPEPLALWVVVAPLTAAELEASGLEDHGRVIAVLDPWVRPGTLGRVLELAGDGGAVYAAHPGHRPGDVLDLRGVAPLTDDDTARIWPA